MKNFLATTRNRFAVAVPALGILATTATAFAADTSVPSVAITSEMLKPIADAVTANIGVILPVGIGIFGIMLGVGLVPKLIKKFSGS